MKSSRTLLCGGVLIAALSPFALTSAVEAQQNGEAHSRVPTVEREVYDMQAFMAALPLSAEESSGRRLYAQRCANCHGGTNQRPGPRLSQDTVARRGEASFRDQVMKGSPVMPGFQYTLDAAQVARIMAFLKTVPPPRAERPGQAAGPSPD
jgi:mono/diheme cytochrome c family protein